MATPMPSDISEIDRWINNELRTSFPEVALLSQDRLIPIEIPQLNIHYLPKNPEDRRIILADLSDQQADIKAGAWKRIDTVGDGTCSLHALLLSTSETYRRLPVIKRQEGKREVLDEQYRRVIGQAFRRKVISPMFSKYPQYISSNKKEILSKLYLDNTNEFLQNEHLQEIMKQLKFNLCCVVRNGQLGSVTTTKFYSSIAAPWVFMWNNVPSHYEAIYLGREKRFILNDREFFSIYKRFNRITRLEASLYPLRKQIDSIANNSIKNPIRTTLVAKDIRTISENTLQTWANISGLNANSMKAARRAGANASEDELYDLYIQKLTDDMEKDRQLLEQGESEEGELAARLGLTIDQLHIFLDEATAANIYNKNARVRFVEERSGAGAEAADPNAINAANVGMNLNTYKVMKSMGMNKNAIKEQQAHYSKTQVESEKRKQNEETAKAAQANENARKKERNTRRRKKNAVIARVVSEYPTRVNVFDNIAQTNLHTLNNQSRRSYLRQQARKLKLKNEDALRKIYNTTAGGTRKRRLRRT